MKARINWKKNRLFSGLTDSGHSILMDGPEAYGGQNAGARPIELLLVGLGGCAAFDVVSILEKKRINLQQVEVDLDCDRADQHPKVFTNIRVHFTLVGREIPEKAVKQAIELSESKFCSASAMLKKTATISITYELRNAE